MEFRELRAAVATFDGAIAEFTSRLMEIPTENPPGHAYAECARAIADHVQALALPVEIIDAAESSPCVTTWYGSGERTLYFHGHYDVVPVSPPGQCRARRDGRHLFGRGSADMKGGLAATLYAIKALDSLDAAKDLRGRIALIMVPDEETGGARGSQRLAQSGRLGRGGIGMLTAEPTGGVIWNANRGAISLRITVHGKPAHVGVHYMGVNAFERMLHVAGEMVALKARIESRRTTYNTRSDQARQSVLLVGGRADGGSNFNVVPGECHFTVDRRFNPEEDLAAERQALLDVIDGARARGTSIDVEVLQEAPSAATPESDEFAIALADSIAEVTGTRASFEMCPGLLETRFYAAAGMPALAYGPGRLEVSHGPNEYVDLDRVIDCATVYALTALRMLT